MDTKHPASNPACINTIMLALMVAYIDASQPAYIGANACIQALL
jgi:hypothetical protein